MDVGRKRLIWNNLNFGLQFFSFGFGFGFFNAMDISNKQNRST
jgi:flagellar biosynthesis protein FliR